LELRKRRGIRVDDIVDTLVSALGIDVTKRAKVKRYYQQLEGGLLEPGGVDGSVWRALATRLGEAVRELAAWRPGPSEPEVVYGRALRHDVHQVAVSELAMDRAAPERDEVDLL